MFYCIWIRGDPGGTGHNCAELENRGKESQSHRWAGARRAGAPETPAVGQERVWIIREMKVSPPTLPPKKVTLKFKPYNQSHFNAFNSHLKPKRFSSLISRGLAVCGLDAITFYVDCLLKGS